MPDFDDVAPFDELDFDDVAPFDELDFDDVDGFDDVAAERGAFVRVDCALFFDDLPVDDFAVFFCARRSAISHTPDG